MSDNDGQVQRLQAEARTKDTTIAELRREREKLGPVVTAATHHDMQSELEERLRNLVQEYETVKAERDSRVTVKEVQAWLNENGHRSGKDADCSAHGILAWRNRPAPTADDSAIEEALRLALADAGRRFAAIGKHGCANDSIAKAELTRLAARCKAIAGSGTTMKDQHDDIDQADYDDMAAHDAQQQAPAEPVWLTGNENKADGNRPCGDKATTPAEIDPIRTGSTQFRHVCNRVPCECPPVPDAPAEDEPIVHESTSETFQKRARETQAALRESPAPVEDEARNGDGDTLEDMEEVQGRFGIGAIAWRGIFNGDTWHTADFAGERPFTLVSSVNEYRITAKHADVYDPECMDFETWERAAREGRGRFLRHDHVGWVVYFAPNGTPLNQQYSVTECRRFCDDTCRWTAITPAQHQHEIAPADSGVCADGLTADGKIPNTTKKEDE